MNHDQRITASRGLANANIIASPTPMMNEASIRPSSRNTFACSELVSSGGAHADHEADPDAGVGLDHGQGLQFFHRLSFPVRKAVEIRIYGRSVVLVSHLDVDHGEHHENVSLQHHDQNVEYRPANPQDDRENRSKTAGRGEQPQ